VNNEIAREGEGLRLNEKDRPESVSERRLFGTRESFDYEGSPNVEREREEYSYRQKN